MVDLQGKDKRNIFLPMKLQSYEYEQAINKPTIINTQRTFYNIRIADIDNRINRLKDRNEKLIKEIENTDELVITLDAETADEIATLTKQVNTQNSRIDSPSTFAVTRRILAQQGFGLNGLNRGLTATIMRNGVFNTFYFGIYNTLLPWTKIQQDYIPELAFKFFIGFMSGTLASCMNIPFDVAKSRIQGPQGEVQYRGTLHTIVIVYQREGFKALYKGLVPKILRLGPGGAIMLIVYEHMKSYLTMTFS